MVIMTDELKEYGIKHSGFKTFKPIKKQWYLIVWSVKKEQIVKTQGLQRQKKQKTPKE